MNSKFGWYYEGGSVQGTGRDYWDVVERALVDALANKIRDARLRVGEMKRSRPSDLIDEDDVREMFKKKKGVSAAVSLVTLVHERYGERVEEGQARFTSLRRYSNSFAELLDHQGREDIDGPCVNCGGEGLETVSSGRGRWCAPCVIARDEAKEKASPRKNGYRPGVCVTTVEITEWPR